MRPSKTTFHLYPIEGVSIPGVPAVEQDVSETEAQRLNEYQPPAFVIDPLESADEEPEPPKEGE